MEEVSLVKKSFKYFTDNKVIIVGILYICAIAKDFIWYSMFGVNIFGFITIQDTLISFLDHNMVFILIILNYLVLEFVFADAKKTKTIAVVKALIFVVLALLYFIISKKPIAFLPLLFILSTFYYLLAEKEYKKLIKILLLFVLLFSIIEPLAQGFFLKRKPSETTAKPGYFLWDKTNGDYYTFEYSDSVIDTKLHKYFLVGNTRDYFFIFNYDIDKCEIIPKSDCKNIMAEFRIFPSFK